MAHVLIFGISKSKISHTIVLMNRFIKEGKTLQKKLRKKEKKKMITPKQQQQVIMPIISNKDNKVFLSMQKIERHRLQEYQFLYNSNSTWQMYCRN